MVSMQQPRLSKALHAEAKLLVHLVSKLFMFHFVILS